MKLMDDYDIIKEDVDNMMEISTWGGQPDPYSKLDSKVCVIFLAYCRVILQDKKPVVQLTVHCFDRCLPSLS